MATRTPQREESMAAAGSSVDKEWVTEHARQVGKRDEALSQYTPSGIQVCLKSLYGS